MEVFLVKILMVLTLVRHTQPFDTPIFATWQSTSLDQKRHCVIVDGPEPFVIKLPPPVYVDDRVVINGTRWVRVYYGYDETVGWLSCWMPAIGMQFTRNQEVKHEGRRNSAG